MKGQSEQMRLYIWLLVAFIMIGSATVPLEAVSEFREKMQARLEAEEIAGVINMMKAAPSQTMHYQKAMEVRCRRIEITDRVINVSLSRTDFYEIGVVQSRVKVTPNTLECKDRRTIQFEKNLDTIEVH